MIKHCSHLYDVLPFFEKWPQNRQKAFCKVFGIGVRDYDDVCILTKDFCDLMWEKVNNGKIIKSQEIYLLRGEQVIISGKQHNEHHWPPSSRVTNADVVKTPADFHKAWHHLFMNLYQDEEMRIFLYHVFSETHTGNFAKLIDQSREEAEIGRGTFKADF